MFHANNSISNILWCLLIALRTAENDSPFTSEGLRRKFIYDWIIMVRQNQNYLSMVSDFTTLLNLLEKIDNSICILDILNILSEKSNSNKTCDLSYFRSAFNTLQRLGWKQILCHDQENIITELMTRREGLHRYAIQLLSPEKAFNATGEMVKPITFHLIFSREDSDRFDAETTFYNEGYQVLHANKDLQLTNNRMIRTLQIGLATLPKDDWDPQGKELWKPCEKSISILEKIISNTIG